MISAPGELHRRWPSWAVWALGGAAIALVTIVTATWIRPDFARNWLVSARTGDGGGPALLSSVKLRDQSGAALSSQSFTDKVLVLNFMFTSCPQVCPRQARELVQVQQALPDALKSKVRFLSVSVDPENDTPAALQQFAAETGINLENWSLAAASPEATHKLALELKAIEPSAGSALPAAHGTSIYLFDRRGRLMQRYMGKPLDRQRLVREIEQLTRLEATDARTAAL